MTSLKIFSALVALLFLQSCAGVDLIDDPTIPERLTIAPRISTLAVGQEQVFAVGFTNKYGKAETPQNVVWRSNAPDKVTIDATGKAKTIALGKATIYATVGKTTDSILLNQNTVVVTPNDTTFLRRGILKPVGTSYSASGNVRIQTVKGITQIITDTNFSVSAGPSLYLLLTNHTNGSYTVTPNGNAVSAVSAQITPNKLGQLLGIQSWTVPTSVNPANYQYIVFYCTLGPVFGFAELK
jgi:hypothetical protein